MRLLLSLGADTSIRDEQGCTPIHQATLEEARLPALIALVESGAAEVDARAIGEWTPLHFAASCGNVAAAEVLLRHGADVHARTAAGATAFMLSARGGSFVLSSKLSVSPVPCCKLLLQVGAGGQGLEGGVGWGETAEAGLGGQEWGGGQEGVRWGGRAGVLWDGRDGGGKARSGLEGYVPPS